MLVMCYCNTSGHIASTPRLAERCSRLVPVFPSRHAREKTRFGVQSVERTPFFLCHYVHFWGRGRGPFRPNLHFPYPRRPLSKLGRFPGRARVLVQECAKSAKVLVISALAEASAIRRQLRACLRHSLGSPGRRRARPRGAVHGLVRNR